MNAETKRHIDAARQVLVGVVPNPASQIDQITNALIYKFMDDMDQAAIKVGGKPSFFVGDLERYAWTRLMDSRMGHQERMNLFVEALAKFSESKQLPELFRSIFRSAFLPYRSPEVLGLFLKEIDFFDYSHPEELGNAYEYLLSIMSSQGDAGQFRTPRHIIDFIVEVVNPTKDDHVLDPACGTGGFLVSAYRHILKQHDGLDDPEKKEKPLTPEQRKGMMNNFQGYDVDPGMVRIAQVNMYLHEFKNPQIFQYNSLSNEERWNEKFDVILANPPFMSPRGGVPRSNKFSIDSNRSEVLFVDYIMNHLRPGGRAGIIVPEGIIFQSGTAHKQLRKNLVEDGLYAVVSLPSGVFAPYSGVKTSILFFDNEIAKLAKDILFVKVGNDGFDLGAQRRPLKHSHLPATVQILELYKEYISSNKKIAFESDDQFALLVSKEKVAEGGDYNLSGDRYRIAADYSSAKWPMVELGKVIHLDFGERITKNNKQGTEYPVYGGGGESFRTDEFNRENEYVIARFAISEHCVRFVAGQFWMMDSGGTFSIKPEYQDELNKDFVGKILLSRQKDIFLCARGGAQKNLNNEHFYELKIPLPPLEIQERIVAELDGYAGIIAGAKQIVQNWRPEIEINPEWEKKTISEVAELEYGIGEPAKDSGEYRYIRITDIGENGELKNVDKKYIAKSKESEKYLLKRGDVLVARTGATFGKTMYFDADEDSAFAGFLIRFNFDESRVNPKYFWCFAQSDSYWQQARALMTGGGQPQFNANAVKKILFPLPSLIIQKQIVEKIEAERALIESAKRLINIYEQKMVDVITKLWS